MGANGSSRENLNEITLLRCFAVISLVLHHVLCIYMADSWGAIDTPMNGYYSFIMGKFIPEANMPLFVFIAGYLMGFQKENKKYNDFRIFAKKKVHRLLIPYVILGALMVLLQPGIPDGWEGMLYGSPNHMWFCLMLFYCYILYYVMNQYTKEWMHTAVAIVSLGLILKYHSMWYIYSDIHIIGGFEIAAYFYFWFWFGACVYKTKDSLRSISAIIFIGAMWVMMKGTIREMAYVMFLLAVSIQIVRVWKMPEKVKNGLERIAKYSFGIYVFHHLILWDVIHVDIVSKYVLPLCETHYILMPIVMFIVAFGLSYILTGLSLQTKVGKYLLS